MPVSNCGEQHKASQVEKVAFDLIQKGNLPKAEILLHSYLAQEPGNPKILNFLGWIAAAANLPQFALDYFDQAIKQAPNWELPQINLNLVKQHLADVPGQPGANRGTPIQVGNTEKFLLVKAWGYGFWSDVSHVLGQLLVAELTGRTPIVYWGQNSLFRNDATENAFDHYFEALSGVRVQDIQNEDFDYWPPKWNHRNLIEDEINKWNGPYSRVAGFYLLGRPEKVVVSDFFTYVLDLRPWIPKESHLFGLSVDELCRYLVHKYLHPKREIMAAVDAFYEEHLASSDFIAVHARGSDKVVEMHSNLDEVNRQYKLIIDGYLSSHNFQRIFLMTDDSRLLDYFSGIYGNKIVATNCRRTTNSEGVHYQDTRDRVRLGVEVMVDAYLAARAKVFVGNGFSNPSLMVSYLKDWPEGDVNLIGTNMHHVPNAFLHNW